MMNSTGSYQLSKTTSVSGYQLLRFFLLFFLLFSIALSAAFAEESESKKKEKKEKKQKTEKKVVPRDPHKATLWALLPGGGQIYNRRYWKIPIVYAGFGVTTYFIITNRHEYLKYNDAYICSAKEDSEEDFTCEDPLAQKYSTTDLQSIRDYYRRNLELSVIVTAAWYILQMLDATVDAHLTHWNVNDDLSVDLQPVIRTNVIPQGSLPMNQTAYNGLRITMNF